MITGINNSKTLTRHIWSKCKCKTDGKKCNSNQKWNNNKCLCKCKNLKDYHMYKKIILWILLHVFLRMANM